VLVLYIYVVVILQYNLFVYLRVWSDFTRPCCVSVCCLVVFVTVCADGGGGGEGVACALLSGVYFLQYFEYIVY
jgi:hypothetical protein